MRVDLNHAVFDAMPKLSRDLIQQMQGAPKLAAWYDALIEKSTEIGEFIKAMDAAGFDMETAAGKVAFCRIAAKWIERRLIELGHPVPYPPSDPRRIEIERNKRRIERLKMQVRELGGNPDDSLSPHFREQAA